jgi:hypothetical protein
MNDFFSNLKDGFMKKSVYLIIFIIIGIFTYFFAYNGGKNSAKYDYIANERAASREIEKTMRTYKNRLDYEYSNKISEIRDSCKHNSLSSVDCRLYN